MTSYAVRQAERREASSETWSAHRSSSLPRTVDLVGVGDMAAEVLVEADQLDGDGPSAANFGCRLPMPDQGSHSGGSQRLTAGLSAKERPQP